MPQIAVMHPRGCYPAERAGRSRGGKYANGHGGAIGRNGTVVEVEGVNRAGMALRNLKNGCVGHVTWEELADKRMGELRLAYGYCTTIHTAQGSTAKEHIIALPAGSQAINGLTAYSGSTRHEFRSWFLTSDHAEHVDVRKHRPLNDARAIDADDKWANVAKHLSDQPEKDAVMAMLERVSGLRRGIVFGFAQPLQPAEQRWMRNEAPAYVHEVGFQRRLARAVERRTERVTEVAKQAVAHVRHIAHARHRHSQTQGIGR